MDIRARTNPFPGLRPFMQEEADLFFGRDRQSDELVRRLASSRFLAVVGTSGSGKSSLVRAGLLPSLESGFMAGAGAHWRMAILRPQDDPMRFLARAIVETGVLAHFDLAPPAAEDVVETTLRRSSLGLVEAARLARLTPHENLLILVDQFEELFRFADSAKQRVTGDEAPAFVKLLLSAAQQTEVPLYVVITMRSDFLGDCARFHGLPEAISDSQYLIPRLTRDELQAVITGPVGVRGGRIAPSLVQRLLNDVGDDMDQLPVLQHALMRGWDHWKRNDPDTRPIELSDLEAIGGMAEALSRHADEAFGSLTTDQDRTIAARLFKCLTERGPDNREIRRPTQLSRIAAIANANPAEVIRVIDVFRAPSRSFLMPPHGIALEGESVIDISHESLIRQWGRLRTWVEEEAESRTTYLRLVEAARLQQAGKGGLWGEPDITYAEQWQEREAPNVTWAERYAGGFEDASEFLLASRQSEAQRREEEERRRQAELVAAREKQAAAEALAAAQSQATERAQADATRMRWIGLVIGLLFLVAVYFLYDSYKANESAVSAQQRGEELLGFLLGEQFLGEIRDVGRSTMLEQVRKKVEPYEVANDQGVALIRGLALRNAGDVELMHGFLAKSVTLFEQALQVIESSPDNLDRQREIARTRERLGEALISQSYVGKALEHYTVAVKAWEQVVTVTRESVKVEDCYNFAESLVSAGELKNRMGKATLAIKDVDKAVNIITTVPLGRCGGVIASAAYPDTKALEVLSRALMARATIFYDEKGYEAAVRLANEAKKLSPTSKSAATQRTIALASLANTKLFDNPKGSLEDYRIVLADFEEFRRRDPANRLSEREQAAVQLLLAEGLVACHQNKAKGCESMSSVEEAEVTNLHAIVTLSVLAEIDPSNMSLQHDLAWAQQGRAKVLEARDQHIERLSALKESERLYHASVPDASDADALVQLGLILSDQSKALADLKRWPEAKETLQRSIGEFEKLEKQAGSQGDNLVIVNYLLNARRDESELLRKARDEKGADLTAQEQKRLEEKYNDRYQYLSGNSEEAEKQAGSSANSVNQGAKLFKEGQYATAISEFNAAESAMRAYIDLKPTDYKGYDTLRNIYYWIQLTQQELGHIKEMGEAGRRMLDMVRIATLLMPELDTSEMDDTQREAQQAFGISLYNSEQFREYIDETLAAVQQEVAAAEANVQTNSNDPEHLSKLSNAYLGQGLVRKKAGKVGWKEAFRISIVHIQKAAGIGKKNHAYQNGLGSTRKIFADGLAADGLKEEAQVEYGLALKAYQQAAKLSPGDKDALNGILELGKLGVR